MTSAPEGSGERAIRSLLAMRTWAVVGLSPDPARDSHRVAALLISRGYHVIPVNPHADEVLGQRCYPSLAALPAHERVDVVDLFRRSRHVAAHVDEAVAIGATGVWTQLGVVDEAAAGRARRAGLEVVMDRCPRVELARLGIPGPA